MIITRGKYKGQHATVHQFSNDWISADSEDGKPLILDPTSVELESDEEMEIFLSRPTGVGTFWREYALDRETRRFRKVGHSRRSRFV